MEIHPRIKDVLLLAPLPLILLFLAPWTACFLFVFLGFLALWEYRFIVFKSEERFFSLETRIAAICYVVTAFVAFWSLQAALICILLSVLALDILEHPKLKVELWIGQVVISIVVIMAIWIRKYAPSEEIPYGGLSLLGLALVITTLSDTGAYFVGKAIGKHKFAPIISPNKTWEGAVGGWIFGALGAYLYTSYFLPGLWQTHWLLLIGLFWALSFAGQMGDLLESAFKRKYGVKDSGNTLRSHGGVMDRFDSFACVLPILSIFLYVCGYA